jgi:HAD superfamily hydrolase (TIGR01509 family)
LIKAIVFDMDGVLVDAREWHFLALNQALALFGLEISKERHLSTFDGLPTSRKLEILSAEGRLPRELHSLLSKLKQQYTQELITLRCKPVFQHQYALSRLKAEGFGVAVASNSISSSIESMMRQSHLLSYLDFYLSNEDVRHPKPDPEIYSLAISKLGLSPDQVLIVEDNEHGLQAAKKSGGNVMQVRHPGDVSYSSIKSFIGEISKGNTQID